MIDALRTARLRLRRWEPHDRPVFHRLNSDEAVMRYFPQRRSRTESDALMETVLRRLDETGLGFLALVLAPGDGRQAATDGPVIGMLGLGRLGDHHPFAGRTEIGWRLLPEHWGKGYATEGALACLRAAFEDADRSEVVAQCVAANEASSAVMRRLCMRRAESFDHPDVDPATHPALVRHDLYRLSRADWTGSPQKVRADRV